MKTLLKGLAGAFVFSSMLVTPLGSVFAQGKGEVIRIQDYPGIGNLLMRVATAENMCEKYGIECKMVTVESAALGAAALLSGSIQVGILPALGLASAVAKGAEFAGFTGALTKGIIDFSVSTEIGTGDYLSSVAKLEGKKVGVSSRGTAGEFFSKVILREAGVDPESVTFVAVGGPPTAYLALSTGQVDAALSWSPMAAMCQVLKTCQTPWEQRSATSPELLVAENGANSLLVATRDYAAENPHVIEAVIAAAKEAEVFSRNPDNFDRVVEIIRDSFEIKMERGDEVLAQAVKNALPGYQTEIDLKGVEGATKAAYEMKFAVRLVPVKEMIFEKWIPIQQ